MAKNNKVLRSTSAKDPANFYFRQPFGRLFAFPRQLHIQTCPQRAVGRSLFRRMLGEWVLYEEIAGGMTTIVGAISLVRELALTVASKDLRHGQSERETLLGFCHHTL